jgi:phosphate starvation-inducible PhoH-like protein
MAKQSSKKKGEVQQQPEILPQLTYSFRIHRKFKLTEKQNKFLSAAKDKSSRIIMVDGLWGTGKTSMALYYALEAIQSGEYDGIIYIRNPIESSNVARIGFLKGTKEEKMEPYGAPGYSLLYEFLDMQTTDFAKRYFEVEAVGFIRGLNWDKKIVIVDEAENLSKEDMLLVMSRIKNNSKVIFVGDSFQKDIRNSGFEHMMELFSEEEDKEHGIYTFEFKSPEDIVRSDILRYIMTKVQM